MCVNCISLLYNQLHMCVVLRNDVSEALIWVVDSAESGRASESCALMLELLRTQRLLRGLPVLILLNKADLAAREDLEMAQRLFGDATAEVGRPCLIQACSAADGRHIDEALQWLAGRLELS